MKKHFDHLSLFLFAAALLLCASFAHSQVQVAIAPDAHPQFLSSTGAVLAGGFVYTYQAGTTTLLNTYIDSTGAIQNANPIPLDATGAPTNNSGVQTGIWLANAAYKFCAYNSALVQQWCTDNVTGYLNLLNLANTWTFQQTFTLPIIDTNTDDQMVFGTPGNQTTLDFPPPTTNIDLVFPRTSQNILGDQSPTINNPIVNQGFFTDPTIGGILVTGGPGTYILYPNETVSGTIIHSFAKFTGSPSSVIVTATSDTSGILGICVSNCSGTGDAIIKQSGSVLCNFAGSTTAGDYVQNSSSINGECGDAGALFPSSGQVLGRVTSTNSSAGTYDMDLFGPEISVPARVQTISAAADTRTVAGNTTAPQTLKTSAPFAAGAQNRVGASFRATGMFIQTPGGGSQNYSLSWFVGNGVTGTGESFVDLTSSTTVIQATSVMTCTVTSTGTSGTVVCSFLTSASAGNLVYPPFGFTMDLTQPLYVAGGCQFSVASTSNVCSQYQLVVEQLN